VLAPAAPQAPQALLYLFTGFKEAEPTWRPCSSDGPFVATKSQQIFPENSNNRTFVYDFFTTFLRLS
jgi:hypothetical protein